MYSQHLFFADREEIQHLFPDLFAHHAHKGHGVCLELRAVVLSSFSICVLPMRSVLKSTTTSSPSSSKKQSTTPCSSTASSASSVAKSRTGRSSEKRYSRRTVCAFLRMRAARSLRKNRTIARTSTALACSSVSLRCALSFSTCSRTLCSLASQKKSRSCITRCSAVPRSAPVRLVSPARNFGLHRLRSRGGSAGSRRYPRPARGP